MTHYQTLGVSEDATLNEIKVVFIVILALRYTLIKIQMIFILRIKFIEVGRAYEVLSDYEKRTEYDNSRLAVVQPFMLQPMRFDSVFKTCFNLSQMNSISNTSPNYSKSVSIHTTNVNGKQKTRKVTVENGKKKVEEYEGFEPGNHRMINYNS